MWIRLVPLSASRDVTGAREGGRGDELRAKFRSFACWLRSSVQTLYCKGDKVSLIDVKVVNK